MKNTNLGIALGVLLICPVASFADMYYGASIGYTDFDEIKSSSMSALSYTNVDMESMDSEDISFSIFGGYEFEVNETDVALQVAWVSLGENSLTGSGEDFSFDGSGRTVNITLETEALAASFVGKKSIGEDMWEDMFLFGKVGIAGWSQSGTVDSTFSDASGNQTGFSSYSMDDTDNEIFFGIGLEFGSFMIQLERYKIRDLNANNLSFAYKI